MRQFEQQRFPDNRSRQRRRLSGWQMLLRWILLPLWSGPFVLWILMWWCFEPPQKVLRSSLKLVALLLLCLLIPLSWPVHLVLVAVLLGFWTWGLYLPEFDRRRLAQLLAAELPSGARREQVGAVLRRHGWRRYGSAIYD